MKRAEKRLAAMQADPRGWRYDEIAAVLRAFGFSERKRGTSHPQWTHPRARPLTLVAGSGKVAEYQVLLAVKRNQRYPGGRIMTVDEYVALPWTVHGRFVREEPQEEPYYLITIDEMDGFSVVADSRAEAEALFPVVLREHIEAFLESGHLPPIPAHHTARPV